MAVSSWQRSLGKIDGYARPGGGEPAREWRGNPFWERVVKEACFGRGERTWAVVVKHSGRGVNYEGGGGCGNDVVGRVGLYC